MSKRASLKKKRKAKATVKRKVRPKKVATKIFVLSGPGGAGKTTLVEKLFLNKDIHKNFIRSISFTTRQPRSNEEEDKDYFFISKEEFLILRKRKFFLENQQVLDDYYGTAKYFYTLAKKKRKHLRNLF